MTLETVKIIHDFGWALMPYALIVWLGVAIWRIEVTKTVTQKETP